MKMSLSASLLLLLLGLSQAHPLMEEGSGAEDEDQDESVDISTMILTSNNGSDEMLLEGDVLVPKTRNAIRCWYRDCLWKKANGLVTVPFTMSSDFTSSDRQKIDKAMKAVHTSTCVRFVPRQNENDYISIENKGGCYSYMGRTGGKQVLSLSRRGCVQHGVIQHEIIHALGFHHEQTRSDRNKHVKINWKNIDPKMAYNFYRRFTNNLNTPYDYSSIMHYGKKAFSVLYGKDSITPIPDPSVKIGQRKGMSFWDIRRINLLYKC